MTGANKILTVSYGTFSCTLEGFDEPFEAMRAIAEYFRDLAAEDRFFGAEPPVPDAEMLARIAEAKARGPVEARLRDSGVELRIAKSGGTAAPAPAADPQRAAAAPRPQPVTFAGEAEEPLSDEVVESVAEKLKRIRAAVAESRGAPSPAAAALAPIAAAAILPAEPLAPEAAEETTTAFFPVPEQPAAAAAGLDDDAELAGAEAPDAVDDTEETGPQTTEGTEIAAMPEPAPVVALSDADEPEAEAEEIAAEATEDLIAEESAEAPDWAETDAATTDLAEPPVMEEAAEVGFAEVEIEADAAAMEPVEAEVEPEAEHEAEPFFAAEPEAALAEGEPAPQEAEVEDRAEPFAATEAPAWASDEASDEARDRDEVAASPQDLTHPQATDGDGTEVEPLQAAAAPQAEDEAEAIIARIAALKAEVLAAASPPAPAAALWSDAPDGTAQTEDDAARTLEDLDAEDAEAAASDTTGFGSADVDSVRLDAEAFEADDPEAVGAAEDEDEAWRAMDLPEAMEDESLAGPDAAAQDWTTQARDATEDAVANAMDAARSEPDDETETAQDAVAESGQDEWMAQDAAATLPEAAAAESATLSEGTDTAGATDDGVEAAEADAEAAGQEAAEAEAEPIDGEPVAEAADLTEEVEAGESPRQPEEEEALPEPVLFDATPVRPMSLLQRARARFFGGFGRGAGTAVPKAGDPLPVLVLGPEAAEDPAATEAETLRIAAEAAVAIASAEDRAARAAAAEAGTDEGFDAAVPTDGGEDQPALGARAQEADVDRIVDKTRSEMEGPESRRRHSAISHLKAAVAATEAERKRQAVAPLAPPPVTDAQFRDDLSQAIRPRRPVVTGEEARDLGEPRPDPLVLGQAQRIDRPRPIDAVQPRRVSTRNLLRDEYDPEEEEFDDTTPSTAEAMEASRNFADFAERMGANNLPELLEAAAAYTSAVEGHAWFSRPQILQKVARIADEGDFTREESLRSFGMLLRQGKIQKIRRGQFVIASTSKFMAEARRAQM